VASLVSINRPPEEITKATVSEWVTSIEKGLSGFICSFLPFFLDDDGAPARLESVNVQRHGWGEVVLNEFQDLALDTYTLQASAAGYATATSSVVVGGNWQQATIELIPQ